MGLKRTLQEKTFSRDVLGICMAKEEHRGGGKAGGGTN